jgi:hypothetical protein
LPTSPGGGWRRRRSGHDPAGGTAGAAMTRLEAPPGRDPSPGALLELGRRDRVRQGWER